MGFLDNIDIRGFEPKEVSSSRWLIVFLGAQSAESEINSIIAKARNLGHRAILKPEYMPPLDVIHTIEQLYASDNNCIKEILNCHVHSKINAHENVAVIFDRKDFDSEQVYKQVIQYLKYMPICSNPFADYTLTLGIENCENGTCRDCKKESACRHNCIYRLICLLLYGVDTATFKLPKELISAVNNSYLNGDMNTIVTRTLDKHGIKYIFKRHSNDAFTCTDVAKERQVALSQVLKCMVGRDIVGNLYIMLIPGNKMLKIKKLRHIAGSIKIDLISQEELTVSLGLIVGAISPMQFIGRAKFYIDQTAFNEETVDISSGSLDAGVLLKTKDLVDLLNPVICDIISDNS